MWLNRSDQAAKASVVSSSSAAKPCAAARTQANWLTPCMNYIRLPGRLLPPAPQQQSPVQQYAEIPYLWHNRLEQAAKASVVSSSSAAKPCAAVCMRGMLFLMLVAMDMQNSKVYFVLSSSQAGCRLSPPATQTLCSSVHKPWINYGLIFGLHKPNMVGQGCAAPEKPMERVCGAWVWVWVWVQSGRG